MGEEKAGLLIRRIELCTIMWGDFVPFHRCYANHLLPLIRTSYAPSAFSFQKPPTPTGSRDG